MVCIITDYIQIRGKLFIKYKWRHNLNGYLQKLNRNKNILIILQIFSMNNCLLYMWKRTENFGKYELLHQNKQYNCHGWRFSLILICI